MTISWHVSLEVVMSRLPALFVSSVVASLLVGAVACGGHSSSDETSPKPDGAVVDAAAPLDASDGGAPATLTLITEPDQGMTPIYDLVTSAKKTIDMTMYELTDTMMTGLLTQAVKNGVTVRVILDQNDEMMDNTAAYDALGAGGVEVHWANPVYEATHQKTITVDGTTSAIMSLNLASTDYPTSRDFAVVTNDANDVAAIEAVFAADFANAAVTPPNGDDLVWSPTSSQAALVGIIGGAKSTLILENEEMSYDAIVTALEGAAAKGVDVKVVMEESRSYTTEFEELKSSGVKLSLFAHANQLYIHAKVILADYGTSTAKVFVGSENFSHASLTSNRELGLITSDPAILSSINTTLASDYAGGSPFTPPDGGPPFDASAPLDAALDATTSDAGLDGTTTDDAAEDGSDSVDGGTAD